MTSIYQDYFSVKQTAALTEKSTGGAKEQKMLLVAKLFVANAKQALQIFESGELRKFDGAVPDRRCDIKAIMVLDACSSPQVQEEAKKIKPQLKELEQKISRAANATATKLYALYSTDDSVLQAHGLCFEVSEEMNYLFRLHLLTVGREVVPKPDGSVVFTMQPQMLQAKLKVQKLDSEIVQGIIETVQKNCCIRAVSYIQQQAADCSLLEERYIRTMRTAAGLKIPISCAFYALKTSLLQTCEKGIPFLVREYRPVNDKKPEKALGFYLKCHHGEEVEVLDQTALSKEAFVFVIECVFAQNVPKEDIARSLKQEGFIRSCLANIACAPQYSYDDDISCLPSAAQEEIRTARAAGQELGYDLKEPLLFKIMHTCSSTVQFEKVG